MNLFTRSAIAALLLLTVALPARSNADLILNVDTSAQEFFFTGTDTGTPFPDFAGLAEWTLGTPPSGPSTVVEIAHEFWTPIGPLQHNLALGDAGIQYFVSWFPIPTTVTADAVGDRTSYASATLSQISFLEAANGTVLTSTLGTGFSDISVVVLGSVASVPEPSVLTALGFGLGVFCIVRCRRRKEAISSQAVLCALSGNK
ncbi:MAG: PEP-CTERM sorting domain-containing protein [Fuerstiella sp.]